MGMRGILYDILVKLVLCKRTFSNDDETKLVLCALQNTETNYIVSLKLGDIYIHI